LAAEGARGSGLEHQLANDLTVARPVGHYLSRGTEAQTQVETLRAAITLYPQDGDALLPTSPRLRGDRFDGESAVAPALLIGRDVQPPDACPEAAISFSGSRLPMTNPTT
jgi:hypothetical protein